jgi:hypothetical protein
MLPHTPPPEEDQMTPDQRSQTLQRAEEYDELARHYEQESVKLQRWRKKRVAQIEQNAADRGEATPYVTVDPASVAYSWAGSDPKLSEYNAGLAIVERRATQYAGQATLQLTLLPDALPKASSFHRR